MYVSLGTCAKDVLKGQPIKLTYSGGNFFRIVDGTTLFSSKSFPHISAGPQKIKRKVDYMHNSLFNLRKNKSNFCLKTILEK